MHFIPFTEKRKSNSLLTVEMKEAAGVIVRIFPVRTMNKNPLMGKQFIHRKHKIEYKTGAYQFFWKQQNHSYSRHPFGYRNILGKKTTLPQLPLPPRRPNFLFGSEHNHGIYICASPKAAARFQDKYTRYGKKKKQIPLARSRFTSRAYECQQCIGRAKTLVTFAFSPFLTFFLLIFYLPVSLLFTPL